MRMEASRTQRESTRQPSPITTQVIVPMSTIVKLGWCTTTRGFDVLEGIWSATMAVITRSFSAMRRNRHRKPVVRWVHAWSRRRTGLTSLCLLYLGAPVPPEQWQATGELLILLYIKTGNQAATVAIGLQPNLEQTKYFF